MTLEIVEHTVVVPNRKLTTFVTSTNNMKCARKRRIKVIKEVEPEKFLELNLDGCKRVRKVNWREGIPKPSNSREIRMLKKF